MSEDNGLRRKGTRLNMIVCRLVLVGLGLLISSSPIAAQLRVSSLQQGQNPLDQTDNIKCIHFSDPDEISVSWGMSLNELDEVRSDTLGMSVEIEAAGGSKVKFTGRFRFSVMRLEAGQDLAINLFGGVAHVLGTQPTTVRSGEIIMGTEHTEYSVSALMIRGQLTQELVVYEGNVRSSGRRLGDAPTPPRREAERPAPASGEAARRVPPTRDDVVTAPARRDDVSTVPPRMPSIDIPAGKKVTFGALQRRPVPQPITDADIQRAAFVYAEVDTAKAIKAGNASNAVQINKILFDQYAAVFSNPTDNAKRFSLAVTQVNNGVTSDAIYQLNKADQYTPTTDTTAKAKISVTKGAAYIQAGRTDAANEQFNKAKTLNPAVFREENLKSWGLNDKARTHILTATRIRSIPQ